MSTILIIHTPELSDKNIIGFIRYNQNTVSQIYYGENGLGFKIVYTDSQGNGVFIEDFANKRTYLKFLKSNKKIYQSIGYILKKDILKELSLKLEKDFLIYIGSTDDLETFQLAPKVEIAFADINEKTVFQEKVIYRILKNGKQA